MKFIFKFRFILKPIYKLFKILSDLPFKLMSYFGLHLGSKIIFVAEKPNT